MFTREQQRAQHACQRITARQGYTENECRKYGTMAHKLPALIRSAGLALALGFVDTRGEAPHRHLLDDIACTVGQSDRAGLVTASQDSRLLDYMRLSREVLAVCVWYKRFAESVLGVKSDHGVPSEDDDAAVGP